MSCKHSNNCSVCKYDFSQFDPIPDYIDVDNNCLCEFDDIVVCPYFEDQWKGIIKTDDEIWSEIERKQKFF